MKWYSN